MVGKHYEQVQQRIPGNPNMQGVGEGKGSHQKDLGSGCFWESGEPEKMLSRASGGVGFGRNGRVHSVGRLAGRSEVRAAEARSNEESFRGLASAMFWLR